MTPPLSRIGLEADVLVVQPTLLKGWRLAAPADLEDLGIVSFAVTTRHSETPPRVLVSVLYRVKVLPFVSFGKCKPA